MTNRIASLMLLILLTVLPAVGQAKVLLDEDFSGRSKAVLRGGAITSLPGGGKAWSSPKGGHAVASPAYVEYKVADLVPDSTKGTIELFIQRNEVEPAETLFSFVDNNGKRLFSMRIEWYDPLVAGSTPFLSFYRHPDYGNLWYYKIPENLDKQNVGKSYFIPLGKQVAKGQWVHV
ncbi:MAG TPA: hypothetical protein VGK27_00010, partial [Candidatus Deferrimicrobiaceae bacterium]